MNLIPEEDYYYDEFGRMVLTAKYLLKRGHCCQSGCMHCPYGYSEKVDPEVPSELQDPWQTQQGSDEGWVFDPDADED